MIDTRNCEQCGNLFVPGREHARFCSARCRVTWNRGNSSDRAADMSALDWSIAAMGEATGRVLSVKAWDRPRAFAVITEAVWWLTIVDATLVRYHHDTYDALLTGQPPAQRRLIEGTLAGLRFVRNRMGHYLDPDDFIQPEEGPPGAGDGGITAWTWKSVSAPALGSLPPRGQAWEMTRYRAYQAQLAGRTIGEIFGRTAAFLKLIAAKATSGTAGSAQAAR